MSMPRLDQPRGQDASTNSFLDRFDPFGNNHSYVGVPRLEPGGGLLNGPPAASSRRFVPPLSNPRASVLRPVGPPAQHNAFQDPRSSGQQQVNQAPTGCGVLAPPMHTGGYEGADSSSLLVGLRLGDFGGRVGLLPGLRPKFVEQYAPPNELTERKRRAPREDLTGYTAEMKVARRNERARIYTNQARERQEEQQRKLELHVQEFRAFEALVETAPRMGLLVLRADLHGVVLYASAPLEQQLLGMGHEQMLGQALWAHMHPADHGRVAAALSDLILTLVPPPKALHCRLLRRSSGLNGAAPSSALERQQVQQANKRQKRKEQQQGQAKQGGGSAMSVATVKEGDTEYVPVRLNMRNGTQGVVVSVWPEARW